MKKDDETLSAERAVRLLRAKAAENEERVRKEFEYHQGYTPMMDLAADIALLADLLADHIEQCSRVEL